ncbi:hypothetical protein F4808DRAFT_369326 [Astrocystis sublimbata]|nr:hypothetical protein F4808DRAFT_369326 [Astrocystis sublimbata]
MGFVAGDLVLEIWLCPLIPKDTSKWTLQKTYGDTYAGLLECKVTGDSLAWPVMILKSVAGSDNKFIRRPSNLLKIDMEGPATFKACRDPRAGETTRLGSIAEDCIYDINKAELRRITIIDHGQQEGFFVNTINHVTKPLQITPVVQSDDFHYKLDSSYPESRNGNIGTIPVFWGQDFMGMAIFSNNNRYPFVVTWGPGQSRGTRPWCKLFTLGKADPSKYEAEKDHLARAIRDSAWKEQEHKSLRLKDFKVNFETVRDKDAVAFGNVYITIKIRDVKVLDREIWQLTIEVKPLARNRLVEKTMMETSEGIRSDADKK